MKVMIPLVREHNGSPFNIGFFEIADTCLKCGARRGIKIWKGLSYDGSKRLTVDCWRNECDHIDIYSDVVAEGKPITQKEYEEVITCLKDGNT